MPAVGNGRSYRRVLETRFIPVIAVPTSVGYGASLRIAALLVGSIHAPKVSVVTSTRFRRRLVAVDQSRLLRVFADS